MKLAFSSICIADDRQHLYEDPQLQDNPAYGTVGSIKVVKREEYY